MELMIAETVRSYLIILRAKKLCPACKEKLEEKFQKVKKYIEENPRENINQVAEACDVTIKQIKYWVREERLSFTDDSLVGLECERCGKMIHKRKIL